MIERRMHTFPDGFLRGASLAWLVGVAQADAL
jgi:hypothetical protein